MEIVEGAPAGMFGVEVGVHCGESETLGRVRRKTDLDKLFGNVAQIKKQTQVVVHLDLIAGLPGENFAGFIKSLQRLFELGPDHIQVEPLKVLHGSPMRNIAAREGY